MAAGSRGVARRPRTRGATLERLILDTTVLITVERTTARLDEIVADADDVVIAAITAAELLVGVTLADRRHEASRRTFVDALLATIPVEPYDLYVARAHAELLAHPRSVGRRRRAHDLLIAATARAHGRTVVTADARGFEDLPGVTVRRLSPGD
jgi:tRNA(fMet)-specific endonuclease VapC